MTCFWDGILQSLNNDDFKLFNRHKPFYQTDLIQFLKQNNKPTINVYWKGEKLRESELKENFTTIKDFEIKNIYNGYLCSVSDPFLFLLCEIFQINILHDYNGVNILYQVSKPRRTVKYKNNSGHFWNAS